jgi:hypothetical protein
VLDEADRIGTIEWIYFEGGEPFLYYPLLIESIKEAKRHGYKTGVVTNAYFATSEEDAIKWLTPLSKMKVRDLSISNDSFHSENPESSYARIALKAARKLGIKVSSIAIEEISVGPNNKLREKGKPVVGGGVMFRGRAADKLSKDLPRVNWKEFTECPYEDLVSPERVHVDEFGNVHLCQGISMGNMWEIPLSNLVKNYSVESHPICKFLSSGGPKRLTEEYNVTHEDSYVDGCHFCYETRKKLIDKFPVLLSPKQVYGLE